MESIKDIINRWIDDYNSQPGVAEPITKPAPTIQPETRPEENDPFNVPAPKIDPTPKGFF